MSPRQPFGFISSRALRHGQAVETAGHTSLLWLVPIWLTGIICGPNLAGTYSLTALAISFLWIVPIAVLILGDRLIFAPTYRQRPPFRICVSLFLLVTGLTVPYSISPETSARYWALTAAGLILCPGLWHIIRGHERPVLARFALLGTLYLAIVYATSYTGFGRFDSINNPNSIGLIVLGLCAAALAINSLAIRLVCVATCGFLLLATQSRSAILGTLLMLIIYAGLEWRTLRTSWKTLAYGLCGLVLFSGSLLNTVGQFVAQTLHLHDRYRGLNSGFTGRTELWRLTYKAWLSNPIFGIGYRAHEHYPGLEMGSHNGYLSLLAETGIVGAVPVLVLFALGLGELIRHARAGELVGRIGTSLVVGYLFLCFFERYTINFGNPTSILVLVLLFVPRLTGSTPRLVAPGRFAFRRRHGEF